MLNKATARLYLHLTSPILTVKIKVMNISTVNVSKMVTDKEALLLSSNTKSIYIRKWLKRIDGSNRDRVNLDV